MPHEIRVCMGSSCFARGNTENLRAIQRYLSARGLAAVVALAGHLCADCCGDGPNVSIDGRVFHGVDPAGLSRLLDEYVS